MSILRFFSLLLLLFGIVLTLGACRDPDSKPWNSPHQDFDKNIRYAAFAERPKSLDPARAYSLDEMVFVSQIYTPPLQYHYLKRPYTLIPFMAVALPKVDVVLGPKGEVYSVYTITIQSGRYYQPHPAFAKDSQGHFYYYPLTNNILNTVSSIRDFPKTATRELIAEDYVYEIKRLAEPGVNSPIFGFMKNYILGLSEYGEMLRYPPSGPSGHLPPQGGGGAQRREGTGFLDLRKYPLLGVKVISRYQYQIIIKGKYPQFIYWLAMNFFAPIPWEADAFYAQPGMAEKNISFDCCPVGAGPYQLIENNPNHQMVLARNPYYSGEYYPREGMAGDKEKGLLNNAGQSLPFIDKVIFSLDKETIPRWYKFLQGYYDVSATSPDNIDQPVLKRVLQEKGISLQTGVAPNLFYIGFNMLDKTVGGNSEKAKKIRQAISIALDYEEYITLFLNGRARAAQGPIPPGIFGNLPGQAGINPVVYNWTKDGPQRKSITVARNLLAQAGYPNGCDAKTGQALVLNFDTSSTSAPDDKARFDWLRKQFAKLGIELQIRSTDYNRFREKIRMGDMQLFFLGWIADYPDPENFLFLFYGPGSKVKWGGENVSNYNNPEFDVFFKAMSNLQNGPERQKLINKMVNLLRQDSPFVWAYYPEEFLLSHSWNAPTKINAVANNNLKYESIDFHYRAKQQNMWNRPVLWPLYSILLGIIFFVLIIFAFYYYQQKKPGIKKC